MAFNDQIYMRFITEEACEMALENLASVEQRDSTDLTWFEHAYHRIRKQPKNGEPFFLLFSRNACGFSEVLNTVGYHFSFSKLGQNSSFQGRVPRIEDKEKSKYPELTISGWQLEDGYIFDIVESQGANTPTRE
jgi:hypothetical protein